MNVPQREWVSSAFLACAVLLVPWVAYLAITLPARATAEHYRYAWVGFDVLLVVTLLRVSWLVYRRDPQVVLAATVAATLLLTDAWFDVATATGSLRGAAIASAVLLEIPGAVLCAVLARRALRQLTREPRH